MSDLDKVKDIISEKGGIATISDFVGVNISAKAIERMCDGGNLSRIKRGYYTLSNAFIAEEQVIVKLIPEAIISLETALFIYGYVDYTPRSWSITVPRTISRSKLIIDTLSFKTHYVDDKYYNIGKTSVEYNGVRVNIYDKERTICDCFKYRNKLDVEIFNKSVKAYSEDENKNLSNLISYAKELRVYNKVIEYMGVLMSE